MTALSEAVHQAQRSAIAALGKRYIAGKEKDINLPVLLDSFGATDDIEKDTLISCWIYLRETGSQAPEAPAQESRSAENDMASQKQLDLIARLCDEKGMVYPDTPLTKQQAHEIINSIKAGTYNPDQWAVPF